MTVVHHPEVKKICAKAYLEYIRELNKRIETLREGIERKRSLMLPSGIDYSGVPSSGGAADALGNGVAKLQDMIAEYATELAFDYQSERHCSKTRKLMLPEEFGFDYQSERHCSKTRVVCACIPIEFDYQSERHCSKTFRHQYDHDTGKELDYEENKRVIFNMAYKDMPVNEKFIARLKSEMINHDIDELILINTDQDGIAYIEKIK